MRPLVAFLLKFLLLAGVFFACWSFGGFGDAYARAVITVANPLIWLVTGFWVSNTVPTAAGLDVIISRGSLKLVMPFQPREIFSGVIPYLALVFASTGLTTWRRLRALAIGMGALFVFHMGFMILGPYMTGWPQGDLPIEWVRRVNTAIDIFYGFYGLVGYAALPFLLWFWLAYQPVNQQ